MTEEDTFISNVDAKEVVEEKYVHKSSKGKSEVKKLFESRNKSDKKKK